MNEAPRSLPARHRARLAEAVVAATAPTLSGLTYPATMSFIFIAHLPKGHMVITCSERGCGATWSVADDDVARLIERGEIVVRTSPQAGYSTLQTVGVCRSCQDKYKREARAKRAGKRNVDAEHGALMHLIAQTRQAHPEWSLEECVKACVDYVNSAAEEKDPAFRAYLLEREDH